MFDRLQTGTSSKYFVLAATIVASFFVCAGSALAEQPTANRAAAIKGAATRGCACNDSFVIKYNEVIGRYRAKMKDSNGMLVNFHRIRANKEDRDALLHWYSQMTDTQRYHIWEYPKSDGRFALSPFCSFKDEVGRVRSGVRIAKKPSKWYENNYLLVLDGVIVDRGVRLDNFDINTVELWELSSLVALTLSEVESILFVECDPAIKIYGVKCCNGAIVITTSRAFRDPLILVDNKMVDVKLKRNFNAKNMTVYDYAKLVGLNSDDIKSINIANRVLGAGSSASDSGKQGVVVAIITK